MTLRLPLMKTLDRSVETLGLELFLLEVTFIYFKTRVALHYV